MQIMLENTDDEQRQEDGDDGTERSGKIAREAGQRLFEEIEETRHRNRTPLDLGRASNVLDPAQ